MKGIQILVLALLVINTTFLQGQTRSNSILGTARYSQKSGLGIGLGYERKVSKRIYLTTFGYTNVNHGYELSAGAKFRLLKLGRLSFLAGGRVNYVDIDYSDFDSDLVGKYYTFNPQLEGRVRITSKVDVIGTYNFNSKPLIDPKDEDFSFTQGWVFALNYKF